MALWNVFRRVIFIYGSVLNFPLLSVILIVVPQVMNKKRMD